MNPDGASLYGRLLFFYGADFGFDAGVRSCVGAERVTVVLPKLPAARIP
jgi:hypothetical protein